jgi:Ca2+-transporting ATPase
MTYLIFIGLVLAVGTLGVIWWGTGAYGEAVARTMGLATFSFANIWFALETADEDRSVFDGSILENPTLLKAAGLAIVAAIAATELGLLNRILETVPLSLDQWVICIIVSLAVVVVIEVKKLLKIQTSEPPVRVEAEPSATPAGA